MLRFPTLDLRRLDPTKIDLTRLDLRDLDLPRVDRQVGRLADLARDAAYVGVGAAVVAAKAADDSRRTLTDGVATRVRRLVDAVA